MEQGCRVMRFWLLKSEPAKWSWDDQVAKGSEGEEWNGVRNYQARKFMRQMKNGDLSFFYHSQSKKAVVGIVSVIAAVTATSSPITLGTKKTDGRLDDMILVHNSRLSVQFRRMGNRL